MSDRLSINLQGLEEVLAKLNVKAVDEAVREATTESLALLLNRNRARFLEQVSPTGEQWEPSFAAFKRSFSGRGGGTLFDTGTLFHSIQLYSVSPTEGAIGTDVPYASAHQFGVGQEQRQFLGFSDADMDLALKVYLKKVTEAIS